MMSLIEVQCPHCGARGQIMMPPVGAIIIGPCPQCNELVVVFCGHVLPLEKQIMESSPLEERRDHLLSVLTEFLQDRITKLMTEDSEVNDEGEVLGDTQAAGDTAVADGTAVGTNGAAQRSGGLSPISQSEIDRFASVDLKLLDNKAYFKSVFEG